MGRIRGASRICSPDLTASRLGNQRRPNLLPSSNSSPPQSPSTFSRHLLLVMRLCELMGCGSAMPSSVQVATPDKRISFAKTVQSNHLSYRSNAFLDIQKDKVRDCVPFSSAFDRLAQHRRKRLLGLLSLESDSYNLPIYSL